MLKRVKLKWLMLSRWTKKDCCTYNYAYVLKLPCWEKEPDRASGRMLSRWHRPREPGPRGCWSRRFSRMDPKENKNTLFYFLYVITDEKPSMRGMSAFWFWKWKQNTYLKSDNAQHILKKDTKKRLNITFRMPVVIRRVQTCCLWYFFI